MRVAFSPCPNDTYLFYALVHSKIEALSIEPHYLDIEALNQLLLKGHFPISKGSIALLPYIQHEYELLPVGAAVGNKCGPLLVGNISKIEKEMRIAIPGVMTTAHLLLQRLYPSLTHKVFCAYHEVEKLILQGSVDAGLLIHETRFTYQDKGLNLLADLGAQWEELYNLPIPLGGIFIKRNLNQAAQVSAILRRSLTYAHEHPQEILPYILKYSQDLSVEVVQKHIALYVTEETYALSEKALKAIELLTTLQKVF